MTARRRGLLLSGPIAFALALSACTPLAPGPVPTLTFPAPTATPSPTAPVTPSPPPPTPSAPASASASPATGTPVTLSCDRLISPQQLYAFNPNYGALPGYTPAAGSMAAKMVSLGGVACGWSNQSSKETIEVAVARPATADRDTAKQMAAAGTPFPGYGVEAYFSKDGNTGVVQAFSGNYWILVQSVAFYEAGDAARLMDPLLKTLG